MTIEAMKISTEKWVAWGEFELLVGNYHHPEFPAQFEL